MARKSVHRNFALADIAERQYGVVTAAQLRSIGMSDNAAQARARRGSLHRIHRGVYAVGHAALSAESRLLAAVLAIGGGPGDASGKVLDCFSAAVSHRSAAFLWGLARDAGPVDVIVRRAGGRGRRAGIRVHRSVSLAPDDVILHGGIPVTRPARTVADLRLALSCRRAGALSARELRRAIRQASVLGLPLGDDDGDDRTRSDLEADFLKICKRHGLPQPEVNVRIGPFLVDFHWPERGVVVETDSYLYHRGKVAFQDDRVRDLDLRRRGLEVLHFSEQQVNEESETIAEVLVEILCGGVAEKAEVDDKAVK